MTVNATTLALVKQHLGDTGTANDTLLAALVDSVSREFEGYIGYPLATLQRTEVHDLDLNNTLVFLHIPYVTSVDEVRYGPNDWDFAGLTALVVDVDYRLGPRGTLYLNRSDVTSGFQKLQVKYTAGLGVADANVPTDLQLAGNIQVAEEWRRKANPATLSIPGAKGARTLDAPHRFLPRVRELLGQYRRLVRAA